MSNLHSLKWQLERREDGQQDPTKEAGYSEAEGSIRSIANRRQTKDLVQEQVRDRSDDSENYDLRGGMVIMDTRQGDLVGDDGKIVAEDKIDGTRYGAPQTIGKSLHSGRHLHREDVHAGRETTKNMMGLIPTGMGDKAVEKPIVKNGPNHQTQEGKHDEEGRPALEMAMLNRQFITGNHLEGIEKSNQSSCRWKRHARDQGTTPMEGGLQPETKRSVEINEEDHAAPVKKKRGKNSVNKSNVIITTESVEAGDQPHRLS